MAEHSFFEYQRLVQNEAEPELIIQLTNRLEEQEQEDCRMPLIESEDASTQKDIEISVTVAFAIEQSKCGLLFHGKYGCTDNQVSTPDPPGHPESRLHSAHNSLVYLAIHFYYHTSSVLTIDGTALALGPTWLLLITAASCVHC